MIQKGDISLHLLESDILFTNIGLLGFDYQFYERQHNIIFNKDMFKKTNQKGMATILYFLLTILNPKVKTEFAICWFPHTQTDMKEFKSLALLTIRKMEQQGILKENILQGKSVLDSANGERVWKLLRDISDWTLKHELNEEPPRFMNSSVEYRAERLGQRLPPLDSTSMDVHIIDRNMKAVQIQTEMEIDKFRIRMDEIVKVQELWKERAECLTEEFHKLKIEKEKVKVKEREIMKIVEEGALTETARVDRIPQFNIRAKLEKDLTQVIGEIDLINAKGKIQAIMDKGYNLNRTELDREILGRDADGEIISVNEEVDVHWRKLAGIKVEEGDNIREMERIVGCNLEKHRNQVAKLKMMNQYFHKRELSELNH